MKRGGRNRIGLYDIYYNGMNNISSVVFYGLKKGRPPTSPPLYTCNEVYEPFKLNTDKTTKTARNDVH